MTEFGTGTLADTSEPFSVAQPLPRPRAGSRLMRGARRARYGLTAALGSLVLALPSQAQYYSNWASLHFSDAPALSGPLADPDQDGDVNLVEFAFGTDPRVAGDSRGLVFPRYSRTSGGLGVEVLERAGHQPGVQIDLYLSAGATNWCRPWWQRTPTNSQPADPPGSIREMFTTFMAPAGVWFVRSAVQLFEGGPEAARYYVATNGSDGNFGTNLAQPFATLGKAAGLANPGDLIYLRGGTYSSTSKVSLSRSGSPTQPIRIRPYPGDQPGPILNFSGQATGTRGIEITGNCWQLYSLEIANAGDNGIYITGKSNQVERCVIHGCQDSGLQLANAGAAWNLILNCDSYRNYDPTNHGGNADGFAAKFDLGPSNVFRGCRCWENSDDGWDLWEATNSVLIESCWSFRNGSNYWNDSAFAGNGNGFKLGGNYYYGPHRVANCVSFANAAHGYDQNNNTAGLALDQNTGWANGKRNFNLNHGTNSTPHVLRNNLSIAGGSSDSFYSGSKLTNNSWQVVSPAASLTDLLSADVNLAKAPRRDDGGLPEKPFLRPLPSGRLVDKGVSYGQPFQGSAPDLGAFETPAW